MKVIRSSVIAPVLLFLAAAAQAALAPGAPAIDSARAIGNAVRVYWSAPASDGGAAVSGYTVTSSPGDKTCQATAGFCDVQGLTYGTSYTFTATATNAIGTGPASAPSAAVTPARAPDPIASGSANSGDGFLKFTWIAPPFDGGSPITEYRVFSPTDTTRFCAAPAGTLTCTVSGLPNGVPFTWKFRVTNAVGDTESLAFGALMAVGPPGAPKALEAVRGKGSAALSWTAPDSLGGGLIFKYTATASPGGKTCVLDTGDLVTPGCTITGLTNGTTYSFTVTATTAQGTGPASQPATATPGAAPETPAAPGGTNVLAGALDLSWTAPSDNGFPITTYTVTGTGGAGCVSTGSPAVPSCRVAGLVSGDAYAFAVTATNALGTSPASPVSAPLTPINAPPAPSNVQVTAGDASVKVDWSSSEPASAPVARFTATANPGGATCQVDTGDPLPLTCTVSGLTPGLLYTFTVAAANAVGGSPASAPSVALKPFGPAAVPALDSVVSGGQFLRVFWHASATDSAREVSRHRAYVAADTARFCESPLQPASQPVSCQITGLVNGRSYDIVLTAINPLGRTAPSAPVSGVPASTPGAPTWLAAVAGDNSLTLSWTAPPDNGAPITGYSATQQTSPFLSCASSAGVPVTPGCTITNPALVNGSVTGYTFTVVATNRMGAGTVSTVSPAFFPGGAPVILSQPGISARALGGPNVRLGVSVSGAPPFVYAWIRARGSLVDTLRRDTLSALTDSLSFAPVTLADSGSYRVVVKNAYNLNSAVSSVFPFPAGGPEIATQPADSVRASAGTPAKFGVSMGDPPPFI